MLEDNVEFKEYIENYWDLSEEEFFNVVAGFFRNCVKHISEAL